MDLDSERHRRRLIILVCGRCRAGKTTYCRRFKNVLHLDIFGIHPKSYPECLKEVETISGDLIVDGIFDTAERRIALLEAYKGGGKKVCVWIDTDLDIIEGRIRRYSKTRKLPEPFEPPTYIEGWDEIIVIRDDAETVLSRGE